MISAISVILIIFWLVIVPFVLGSFLESGYVARCQTTYNKMISRTFIFGFAFMLASFQIVAVPLIYVGAKLTVLTNIWTAIILVSATVSACAYIYNRKLYKNAGGGNAHASNTKKLSSSKNVSNAAGGLHNSISAPLSRHGVFSPVIQKNRRSYRFKYKWLSFFRGSDREALFIWAAAIIIIAFETSLLIFRQHTDTDDARFLAESLEAFEKNTLLRMHPITGEILSAPIGEMRKDVTSPYPILIAVLARLTMMHPTVLAHSVLPVLLIPLSFASMYVLGRYFFNDKRNSGVFMLVLSVIVLFSFESIYSIGYTLLTIIWQGRSIYMTVLLPLTFFLLIQIYTEGIRNNYVYVCLCLLMTASADLSGTATVLSIVLSGTYALCEIIVNKKFKSAVKIGLSTLPVIIYFLFYKVILT